MYREGKFRAWRPNPICICAHPLARHDNFGICKAGCSCSRFRSKKQVAHYKAAKERLQFKHFDSNLEKRIGVDLERQLLAGELAEVKSHWPLDLYVNGRKICRHYIDFRVVYPDGRVKLIEGKGLKGESYIIKRNLMEATFLKDNPEIEYQVIR